MLSSSAESLETLHISLRTLGGTPVETLLPVRSDERVVSLAVRIHEAHHGQGGKLPEFIWEDIKLPFDQTLADVGVADGAELLVDWLDSGQRPPFRHRNANVLEVRPQLDDRMLNAALASMTFPESKLSLAGCKAVEVDLAGRIPVSLRALDIRQCNMNEAQIEALFKSLPACTTSLEASRNLISNLALQHLSVVGCRLKVLDVGSSDLVPDFMALQPLLGETIEELGLCDIASVEMVIWLAPLCPNLRKLDISFARGFKAGRGEDAWKQLGGHCPLLQEVYAQWCECPPSSLASLAGGCPMLHALVIGKGSGTGLTALEGRSVTLNLLDIEVSCADEVAIAARLDVRWLVLRAEWESSVAEDFPFDRVELFLKDIVATDVELRLAEVSQGMVSAVGSRLRGVSAEQVTTLPGLLPSLVDTSPLCHSLLELRVAFVEQILSQDLIKIAANCPLLEIVHLNADQQGFQRTPIDEGVLALGRHCHQMRHLDLYDRWMRDAAGTLATACSGWPRLRYLCAAGTRIGPRPEVAVITDNAMDTEHASEETEWGNQPELRCLPESLAKHCPLLEELVLYPAPMSWRETLMAGCPLLNW